MGWDSSVGIATRYGLDGPGDRMSVEARYSTPVQTGPVVHPTSCTMVNRLLSRKKAICGVALTTQPLLAPMLKKEYSYNYTPPLGLHGLF